MGFAFLGNNVSIHRSVQIISPKKIRIGNNVRVDCFALLSAGNDGIVIGNNVHLAASVYIFGSGGKVILEDFCGCSSRVSIYTATDDYSDGFLTNPTIPAKFRKITSGDVILRKHAIIGSGSVIMPGIEIGLAASVGALTFVRKNIENFSIAFGNPPKIIGRRDERILNLEKEYLEEAPFN